MLPDHLLLFRDQPQEILIGGSVQLIDVMGDDQAIVNAARVSYGTGTKRVSEDRHLIRYLMRHQHTTPFEMCELVLRVRVPMDTWRQWVRHRTASINEYSTRYSEAIDARLTTDPTAWRLQAKDNKQGSDGFVSEYPEGQLLSEEEARFQDQAVHLYQERLKFGVAREQARKDLPLSTFTEAYWKCDLKNLLGFLKLRMDEHAQYEIRQYANAIAEILKVWVPWTWEAFEDYTQRAVTFSRLELEALFQVLDASSTQKALEVSGLKGRELAEFRKKLTTQ